MRKLILVLATSVFVLGCPTTTPVSPQPRPVPDSDLCGDMCKRIGPKTADNPNGLGCEEGEPVYDSNIPGEPGKPNLSCEAFCVQQQKIGVFINPRCVMQVKSCNEIEAARKKTCQ